MNSVLVAVFAVTFAGVESRETIEREIPTAVCLAIEAAVLHGRPIEFSGDMPRGRIVAAECRPPCDCEDIEGEEPTS